MSCINAINIFSFLCSIFCITIFFTLDIMVLKEISNLFLDVICVSMLKIMMEVEFKPIVTSTVPQWSFIHCAVT